MRERRRTCSDRRWNLPAVGVLNLFEKLVIPVPTLAIIFVGEEMCSAIDPHVTAAQRTLYLVLKVDFLRNTLLNSRGLQRAPK